MGMTQEDIEDAIKQGNNTLDMLMEVHGVALGCSICKEEIENILEKEIISLDLDIHPDSQ